MLNWTHAYIGIGSNLGDSISRVLSAFDALNTLDQCRNARLSPLYRSRALGPSPQNDYINAACTLETTLTPEALLDQLQDIEHQHHRIRTERWGPRTLDLDLLLYGEQEIHSDRLIVPHKEMTRRDFVLQPLLDLQPALTLLGRPLCEWLKDASSNQLFRLSDVEIARTV